MATLAEKKYGNTDDANQEKDAKKDKQVKDEHVLETASLLRVGVVVY